MVLVVNIFVFGNVNIFSEITKSITATKQYSTGTPIQKARKTVYD